MSTNTQTQKQTQTQTGAIDEAKLNAFMGKVIADFGASASAVLVVIGDKLGLYKAMAGAGPLTPAELAKKTDTNERYVREWLNANAAGGYVAYDATSARYTLPPEQAMALADESSPAFIPGFYSVVEAMMRAEERIRDSFRTGAGMAWGEHAHCLFEGTERFFRPGYVANLTTSWLPALDGAVAKLEAGGNVADVGCGLGASTIIMAKAYPRARFVGFDVHPESIALARKRAAEAGVADRVTFEVARSTDYSGSGYDLVAHFDCLHDMGDPVGAARHVRRTLAPDGIWMIVEPFAGDKVEDNLNPVGRIFYSASTMLCVPSSLSEHGPALGAQAGEARLRGVVTEGGFTRFRRATETPFNLILEARP
jgi:2-polyprenyl-3-methyl-5-hydroxy-6-metoxy-1,4-benzoquinol methylase